MIHVVAALSSHLDTLPDGVVIAIADAVLSDWHNFLPEVDRARLARVLLVVHASSSWSSRREVEAQL